MPESRVSYTADGATDTFSVPFPYILQSHIEVYVDDVQTTSFTWATSSTITLSSTPSNGATVLIKRVTPGDARIVDYTEPVILDATTLDLDANQMFYLIQELVDNPPTIADLGTLASQDADDVEVTGGSIVDCSVSNATLSNPDINGGTIDGTLIGGSSRHNGFFQYLDANAVDIESGTINNTIIGNETPAAGTFTEINCPSASLGTVAITGGALNGTIGGSVRHSGAFTTVAVDNELTAGSINSTPIGTTTPSTAVVTTLTADSIGGDGVTPLELKWNTTTMVKITNNGVEPGNSNVALGMSSNPYAQGHIELLYGISCTLGGTTHAADGVYQAISADGSRVMQMKASDSGSYLTFGSYSDHNFSVTRYNTTLMYWLSTGFLPHADNTMDLGDATHRFDDIFATNASIQTSDRNLKEQIESCDLGLDFVMALDPVSFVWKPTEVEAQRDIDTGEVKVEAYTKQHSRRHYGLISQDVESVLETNDIATNDFAGFIKDSETGRQGLRYSEFIAPLIKAIQELNDKVTSLETEVTELKGT